MPTELIYREDQRIARLQEDVDRGVKGAAGNLRQAEARHEELTQRRERRRAELECQCALTLQDVQRMTGVLILPLAPGTITLDRVHIAMLLQAAGKSNALRTVLKRNPNAARISSAWRSPLSTPAPARKNAWKMLCFWRYLSKADLMTTDRIEINPQVMMGKPLIKGTRITVEMILRKLSEGCSEDDLLDAYPRVSREDVRAAIRYAADAMGNGQNVKHAGSPRGDRRHELERLIAASFPAEGKEQRVAAALRVLETLRFGIPIDIETAKWAAQDPEL